jgi:hypothetical protein
MDLLVPQSPVRLFGCGLVGIASLRRRQQLCLLA